MPHLIFPLDVSFKCSCACEVNAASPSSEENLIIAAAVVSGKTTAGMERSNKAPPTSEFIHRVALIIIVHDLGALESTFIPLFT